MIKFIKNYLHNYFIFIRVLAILKRSVYLDCYYNFSIELIIQLKDLKEHQLSSKLKKSNIIMMSSYYFCTFHYFCFIA